MGDDVNRRGVTRAAKGFTLVEIAVSLVVVAIMAVGFLSFLKPAVDGYLDSKRRADLTDMADTALNAIRSDVRSAVPNSVNVIDPAGCFQLIPTVGGGRYRMGPDTVNDAAVCAPGVCSAWPDPSAAEASATSVDLLSNDGTSPVDGDALAINNQNGDDAYTGASRFAVVGAPTVPRATDGIKRLVMDKNPAPSGYDGGRFQVVSKNAKSVVYVCSAGRLFRVVRPSFAKVSGACPAVAVGVDAVVATDVESCEFLYDPTVGEKAGYLWTSLTMTRSSESIRLGHGSHVDNQP